MKLVVEIDDETYEDIKKGKVYNSFRDVPLESALAIANGTPLPKGHGRKFEEIVAEYPPADFCPYPEYRGKAYFTIKYEENGEHIIGFGTYKPEVLSSYLQEYFIAPTIIEADKEKSCSNCKFWRLDKNDENRRCRYCYHQDEWQAESEEQKDIDRKECKYHLGQIITIGKNKKKYEVVDISSEPWIEFEDGSMHYGMTIKPCDGSIRDAIILNDAQID